MKKSIQRFSDRAEIYDRFRPQYPLELYNYLYAQSEITEVSGVADVAAGTGIFTQGLLSWNCPLLVIEPNAAMRLLAEKRLAHHPHVQFSGRSAEELELPGNLKIQLFTVAQAFHWFEPTKTKRSFLNVAAPSAKVALIWNTRSRRHAFEAAYENFIVSFAAEYERYNQHRVRSEQIREFFAPVVPIFKCFEHTDILDFNALWGRTQSYSFMPGPESSVFASMKRALERIFSIHQENGVVHLNYITRLYLGSLLES